MTDARVDLVEVRIIDMPLDVYRSTAEHHDALFREFALVMARPATPGHEVTGQLLGLIEELNDRFSRFTESPQAELQAALDRGDATVNLTYHVPAAAGEGADDLRALLAQADEYCRHGDLLTVAPPPEAVRLRNWFLEEFVVQIDGREPTPWPEYEASNPL